MKNSLTFKSLDSILIHRGKLNENDIHPAARIVYINNKLFSLYRALDGLNDPWYQRQSLAVAVAPDMEILVNSQIVSYNSTTKALVRASGSWKLGQIVDVSITGNPAGVPEWNSQTTPSGMMQDVAYSPTLAVHFVAVGSGGAATAISSVDGVNWINRTTPADRDLRGVVWADTLGMYVAVGQSGATTANVLTSIDGINWVQQSHPAGSFQKVVWSHELGLLVAVGAGADGTHRLMTSSNGTAWTSVLHATTGANILRNVTWASGAGLFMAVGDTGLIMSSPDGAAWTIQSSVSATNWYGVAYSPLLSRFVICGLPGSAANEFAYSNNFGVTWFNTTVPLSKYWDGVSWSPERAQFVAVAYNASSEAPSMWSDDGLTWHPIFVPVGTNAWRGLVWAADAFNFWVSSAFTNVGTDIMTTTPAITAVVADFTALITAVTNGGLTATLSIISGADAPYVGAPSDIRVFNHKSASTTTIDLSALYVKSILRVWDNAYAGAKVRLFREIKDPRIFSILHRDPYFADQICWMHRGDTLELFVGASATALGTVNFEYRGKPAPCADFDSDIFIDLPPEENQMLIDEVMKEYFTDAGVQLPEDVAVRLGEYQKRFDAAAADEAKAESIKGERSA